ncbi:type IV pilus assembly protein PilM [Microterricola viridarii]|uniref:Type IV pilus assembly protein PilM n=1 Tax=Microterricola viridarii TaxID=412690 RepID=A0A1H1PX74_9MICO|nr:type IV pilus assembly protein PilM [Microterricola viridarii]SDS15724.1 type IV pilus assembly protein PilM [Microterricola viridarii]
MAQTVVGVDFAAGVVRAVEVGGSSRKPMVERYAEVAVPLGAIVRGEVMEPHTVATALRQLWSNGGFSSKNIAIGIGNHRVLARDLTVARASRERIRESLPHLVQDMLPMPVADALLDFYPVAEIDGEHGPQVQGLLVAAAKDAVLGNIKAAKLAGLKTVEVDLVPFALSRVYLRGPDAAGTVALAEIGGSTTTVVIATDGVPQFIRIIPTGSDQITLELARRLEIDPAQAEQLKRQIGLSATAVPPEYQKALEVIYEVAGELLTSLRNTINYFNNTRPDQPVRQILLAGGGAALPGCERAVNEVTRMPVVVVDPLAGLEISRKLDENALRQGRPNVAVALGLTAGRAA